MTTYRRIQTVIFSIFLLCTTTIAAHAADATFSWTANVEPVSGYKIHYGTSSRNYTFVVDVGLPAAVNGSIVATVTGLQEGQTYYFAATAYSATEKSDYSDEVVYTVPGTSSTPEDPPVDDTSAPADTPVAIEPVNNTPVADSTSCTTNENSSYSGQLSATDTEGDNLTYSLVTQAGSGTVNLTASGFFTYTPNPNIFGTDSFTFKVNDGSSDSNTASIHITINEVNHAPTVTSTTFSVDQNTVYSGQLAATDADGDTLSFSIAAYPEKGTLVMNSNGSFTYTPDPNAAGDDQFTFISSDGTANSNTGTVNIQINAVANAFGFEAGELLVTSAWQHVDFSTQYVSPALVAKLTTTNDPATGLVAIKNLTSTGFDIRIREWDYGDGVHPGEIVSFMAMERGYHQITDNVHAAAGCTGAAGLGDFQPVTFTSVFASRPVVVSSLVTDNQATGTTLRMKDVTSQGFSIAMQEQEYNDGNHTAETFCYIAMEEWAGVVDGLMVEVGSTPNTLTNTTSKVLFKQQFPTIPFVLADMQSANDLDTATLAMRSLSVTDTEIFVLEEQSADIEVGHAAETGGYFAITPYSGDEDSDNDGLTNAEELAFNTHPGLWDTDQDGISDGEEYRQSLIPATEPEAESDNDNTPTKSKRFNSKNFSSVTSLFSKTFKNR